MRPWILLALALSACPPAAAGDDDDSGPPPADDDDTTPARVEPAPGIWALTLTAITADDCNLQPSASAGDSLGSTTLALVPQGPEAFTLTDSDDQRFRCTWTKGSDFVCEADPWIDSINAALFPNATLHREGSRTGTFQSATSATLTNTNVDACKGTDCPLVEQAGGYTFPCTLGFTATMAR
jgi:hypothetical protein